MRHLTFFILASALFMPSVSHARMPIVDISAGGVSARSAFGEDVAVPVSRRVAQTGAPASTRTRTFVPRATVSQTDTMAHIDTGGMIADAGDILVPHRPSNDLWAKTDNALRMPTADEFSVIRSDAMLPEESLDSAPVIGGGAVVARAPVAPVPVQKTDTMSHLDGQIARLVELQRRAADSVRDDMPDVVRAGNVFSANVATPDVQTARPALEPDFDAPRVASSDVNLHRMVVPMTDDVIVRSVKKNISPRISAVRDDMTKMSPAQLRNAFRKTFLSENKHLSTYSIDDSFDVASDMSSSIEGFTAQRDLSEQGGIRPLEIKITFRNEDSALSRENYNLLTEYAGIVVSKPTRAIQIAIPQFMTSDKDSRKLAARRLAIVEQVLTDSGVSQQRIVPVLSNRNEQGFVLRIISGEQYETMTQQQRDIFGDTINKKTYKSMTW